MSRGPLVAAALACLGTACGDNSRLVDDAAVTSRIDSATAQADAPRPVVDAPVAAADANHAAPAPIVIVLIGDGMGPGQLEAASLFRFGEPGKLAMQALPVQGQLRSAGPSGTTDSAAAATVMATGVYTWNYAVGIDRDDVPHETLLERAKARGMATGLVTTTEITHATPAGFSAHVTSRGSTIEIANMQARVTQADVMLGGGAQAYAPMGAGSIRNDDGLFVELAQRGYVQAATKAELDAAVALPTTHQLVGLFAPSHMTYVAARLPDTTEPTLTETSLAALTVLDRDPDGAFLMIEGGRIDHGGHGRNLVNSIQEALAFDDAIAAVHAWAQTRGNVTMIITADHECGGLQVVTPAPAGVLPTVTWRWGNHTNARVPVFADGPGTELLAAAVIDHRSIYAVARGLIDGVPAVPPARETMPDGEFGDLRVLAASQARPRDEASGKRRLDAMYLDVDARSLTVGLEGAFDWDAGAVTLLVDIDSGDGSGVTAPHGQLDDSTGQVDTLLSTLPVEITAAGFGAEFAVASVGGSDPAYGALPETAGMRRLARVLAPQPLRPVPAVVNYGAVRYRAPATAVRVPGQGVEFDLFWADLFPAGLPVGATLGLVAMQSNAAGTVVDDQLLPTPSAAPGPGRVVTADRVVIVELDVDHDGVLDDLPTVHVAP